MSFTAAEEDVAVKALMKLLADRRWAKATPEQRAEQGRRMRAGRKLKKGKKRG